MAATAATPTTPASRLAVPSATGLVTVIATTAATMRRACGTAVIAITALATAWATGATAPTGTTTLPTAPTGTTTTEATTPPTTTEATAATTVDTTNKQADRIVSTGASATGPVWCEIFFSLSRGRPPDPLLRAWLEGCGRGSGHGLHIWPGPVVGKDLGQANASGSRGEKEESPQKK